MCHKGFIQKRYLKAHLKLCGAKVEKKIQIESNVLVARETDLVPRKTDLVATETDLVAKENNWAAKETVQVAKETGWDARESHLAAKETDFDAEESDLVDLVMRKEQSEFSTRIITEY